MIVGVVVWMIVQNLSRIEHSLFPKLLMLAAHQKQIVGCFSRGEF
jgi:hypothetical protein